MATVINSITGEVLYGTFSDNLQLLENEGIIYLDMVENFISPYYNFETQSFYENASSEEVAEFEDAKRSELIKSAYEQRKVDGWQAYQEFRAGMVKEIYDQVLTKQQAFIIEDFLGKGYDKIAQQGDWETAYYKLSTTVIPEQYAFVQSYLDAAKAIMLQYIQKNYRPM
jgi:hypothetical protein